MKPRGLVALLSLSIVTSLVAPPARAQMSEGEKKAAARAAYQEGVQLQDQGKPAEALAKFEAAQKLYDAPTHLLHIAETQALLGKLVEASETYEVLIRKTLPPGSPEVFVQAQEQARAEAPALRQRIPTLKVTLKPEPSTLQNLVVTVNDKQMPNELVGIARPVNPGPYRLSATANGWATRAPADLELKEKETKSVELVLQQGGGGAVVTPVPPPYGATPEPQAPGQPATGEAKPPEPAPKKDAPPSAGLLFGAHTGLFVPSGSVGRESSQLGITRDVDFERFATAGGGLGLDFFGRFARVFLAGARLEAAFLGGPDSKTIASGQTVTSSSNMFGGAALVGLLTSSERVGFYSDVGFGYRRLNYSQTAPRVSEASFGGTFFGLSAGLSIPAGPIRIVPKVGVDFGRLSPTGGSTSVGDTTVTFTRTADAASYQLFFVGVSVFYNLNLGKKPPPAAAGPAPWLRGL